uniref:Uncharacterized protein n=1 Tax=Lepeophtheirus salmonis TaxID=72036 RepID=A0A0K2TZ12_LEPSM
MKVSPYFYSKSTF